MADSPNTNTPDTNDNTLDIDSAAVTARQVVAVRYGDPVDVLKIVEVELPAPDQGQVVVAVEAIGVNPIDAKIVRGVMGTDESALPRPIGNELSGTVRAVGPGTNDFAVGDPVIGYPVPGAYADHVVVGTDRLHRRPESLDVQRAAGLLLAGVTAADAVATAQIAGGDVVVVHGGAGAVGVVAVQLAVKAGATVIATAAQTNHAYLRGLGAIPVTYGDGLIERIREGAPGAVTAAVDTVGTDEAIDVSLELVVDRSRIVSIAAFGRAAEGIVVIAGPSAASNRHRAEAIEPLIASAADGSLVTEVAATYPMDRAGHALADLSGRHPRGKFVLLP
ncbi:zinc-binding dehydrogenase [Gordonia sp. N1V]|uniref:alcohol dehydrogenase catalytic domain-containing protein n=1 Tax=Gordonia sp. N1V TaxID=3034163 RepID=UPI0023E2866B|nr:zinc-binding dehydrogenase [Gordonia sp. N1V]MDF3282412.1 alcohol dehydrogenase catalytic domain-containing protein [Gordonia sp. N1V]